MEESLECKFVRPNGNRCILPRVFATFTKPRREIESKAAYDSFVEKNWPDEYTKMEVSMLQSDIRGYLLDWCKRDHLHKGANPNKLTKGEMQAYLNVDMRSPAQKAFKNAKTDHPERIGFYNRKEPVKEIKQEPRQPDIYIQLPPPASMQTPYVPPPPPPPPLPSVPLALPIRPLMPPSPPRTPIYRRPPSPPSPEPEPEPEPIEEEKKVMSAGTLPKLIVDETPSMDDPEFHGDPAALTRAMFESVGHARWKLDKYLSDIDTPTLSSDTTLARLLVLQKDGKSEMSSTWSQRLHCETKLMLEFRRRGAAAIRRRMAEYNFREEWVDLALWINYVLPVNKMCPKECLCLFWKARLYQRALVHLKLFFTFHVLLAYARGTAPEEEDAFMELTRTMANKVVDGDGKHLLTICYGSYSDKWDLEDGLTHFFVENAYALAVDGIGRMRRFFDLVKILIDTATLYNDKKDYNMVSDVARRDGDKLLRWFERDSAKRKHDEE